MSNNIIGSNNSIILRHFDNTVAMETRLLPFGWVVPAQLDWQPKTEWKKETRFIQTFYASCLVTDHNMVAVMGEKKWVWKKERKCLQLTHDLNSKLPLPCACRRCTLSLPLFLQRHLIHKFHRPPIKMITGFSEHDVPIHYSIVPPYAFPWRSVLIPKGPNHHKSDAGWQRRPVAARRSRTDWSQTHCMSSWCLIVFCWSCIDSSVRADIVAWRVGGCVLNGTLSLIYCTTWPYGPWSKGAHYIGNRVSFATQRSVGEKKWRGKVLLCLGFGRRTPHTPTTLSSLDRKAPSTPTLITAHWLLVNSL